MELNGFQIKDYNVHGFVLNGKNTGKVDSICPFCSHTRKPQNQKIKCATAYLDTGYYKCHHCGEEGQLHSYEKNESEKTYTKPKYDYEENVTDEFKRFAESRNVSLPTLKRFKVKQGRAWMPQDQQTHDVIQIPYILDGEVINIKSRCKIEGKKAFRLEKNAEKVFYNIDAIKTHTEAIIVEGEPDVWAMYESGLYNVVSVPNGFNLKGNINTSYLDDYLDYFTNKEKIILAVDNDAAGEKGKEELIRRLGPEKCFEVDFKDCKDSNEYLIKYGPIELQKVIDNAKEIPLENVQTVGDYLDDLEKFYTEGMPRGLTCGIESIDKYYSINFGQFCVVTGPPQCFTKNQKILTNKGSKEISKLVKGDLVLSYNENLKKNEYKKVINTMVNTNTQDKIIKITLKNGTVIQVTENHRFYNGTSYVKIKDLLLSSEKYKHLFNGAVE